MRRRQGARKPGRGPGARPATSAWGGLPLLTTTTRQPGDARVPYFPGTSKGSNLKLAAFTRMVFWRALEVRFLVSLTGGVRPVRAPKAMEPKPPVPVSSTATHYRRTKSESQAVPRSVRRPIVIAINLGTAAGKRRTGNL